ncbi:hypothetical protein GIB67_008761 [Kingdonia uniflora]|uniref:Malic enzyme NAD-binding domain-containing protein n=1 Tax=Kingdonia uniflora TaxID=39325 RepID=A0A7J7P5I7_9MAGN|nr:hypothetical protein GIB67_008761 [Kingdonia uniflora]
MEEENITSTFKVSASEVAVLDPCAETSTVEQAAKVKLPFWLAQYLRSKEVVTIDVPPCFNKKCCAIVHYLVSEEIICRKCTEPVNLNIQIISIPNHSTLPHHSIPMISSHTTLYEQVSTIFKDKEIPQMSTYQTINPMLAGIGVVNAARKTMARMSGNNESALESAKSQFWVVDANVRNGRTGYYNQGNNMYLFPGIGLGTLLSGSHIISDGMLQAAAECLAAYMTEDEVLNGAIYPSISRFYECNIFHPLEKPQKRLGTFSILQLALHV